MHFRRLLPLLFLCNASFAHGNHDHTDSDALSRLAEQAFFVNSGPLPAGSSSYVVLPDGTHYSLDSQHWAAARKIAQLLEQACDLHACTHGQENKELTKIQKFLVQQKQFWVQLSGLGADYLYRYGPTTAVVVLVAEMVEHTFIHAPVLCAAIQTSCIMGSKHLQRFLHLIRYPYPNHSSLAERTKVSLKQWQWNFAYWRSMKTVLMEGENYATKSNFLQDMVGLGIFDYDNAAHAAMRATSLWAASFVNAIEKPSDEKAIPSLSPITLYFAAQEKIALLEIYLSVAKDATSALIKQQGPWKYLKVRAQLATVGHAIDRYSTYLTGAATAGILVDPAVVKQVDKQFLDFFLAMNSYMGFVEQDVNPMFMYKSRQVFEIPKKLLENVKRLQKVGCDGFLNPEEK